MSKRKKNMKKITTGMIIGMMIVSGLAIGRTAENTGNLEGTVGSEEVNTRIVKEELEGNLEALDQTETAAWRHRRPGLIHRLFLGGHRHHGKHDGRRRGGKGGRFKDGDGGNRGDGEHRGRGRGHGRHKGQRGGDGKNGKQGGSTSEKAGQSSLETGKYPSWAFIVM